MAKQTRTSSGRRSLAAVALLVSSLGLTVTGVTLGMLHKEERAFETWAHAHFMFALIFIVFAIWHIVLNWRCMLNYIGLGARK